MIKKLGRNDHCWCGSGKKYKACHEAFDDKLRYLEDIGHIVPSHKLIKTPEQIEKIKESARINVACLDAVAAEIHEGMNTAEIDKIVYDVTTDMGGIPAPLNYEGYPYSVCTSVNEQVCHGFPSKDVILKSGDIVNVDCSTILHGYFSDSSRMFCIGDVKPDVKKLVDVTKECVELGLEQVKPWGFLGDMGQAVHDHAYANGYTVVREIGAHAVGLDRNSIYSREPIDLRVSLRKREFILVSRDNLPRRVRTHNRTAAVVPVSVKTILTFHGYDLEALFLHKDVRIGIENSEAQCIIRRECLGVRKNFVSGTHGHNSGVPSLAYGHPINAVKFIIPGRKRAYRRHGGKGVANIGLAQCAQPAHTLQTIKRGEGRSPVRLGERGKVR